MPSGTIDTEEFENAEVDNLGVRTDTDGDGLDDVVERDGTLLGGLGSKVETDGLNASKEDGSWETPRASTASQAACERRGDCQRVQETSATVGPPTPNGRSAEHETPGPAADR